MNSSADYYARQPMYADDVLVSIVWVVNERMSKLSFEMVNLLTSSGVSSLILKVVVSWLCSDIFTAVTSSDMHHFFSTLQYRRRKTV